MPPKPREASIHPKDGRRIVAFKSQAAFREWLAGNWDKSSGIWIKFAKKDSGIPSINYAQALDVALCFGWIDSQVQGLDERFYLQRFTPRGPKSIWSKINCAKVEKLITAGEMQPGGLREIQAAKSDGRWERAYHGQREMGVPADFQKQLDASKKAAKAFQDLSRVNRYAILFRIHGAKKPETRQRRIEQFIEMLKKGQAIR